MPINSRVRFVDIVVHLSPALVLNQQCYPSSPSRLHWRHRLTQRLVHKFSNISNSSSSQATQHTPKKLISQSERSLLQLQFPPHHQQLMSLSKHQLHNTHLHRRSEIDQNCLAQIFSSTPQIPQKYDSITNSQWNINMKDVRDFYVLQLLLFPYIDSKSKASANFSGIPHLTPTKSSSLLQNLRIWKWSLGRWVLLLQAHLAPKGLDLPHIFDMQLGPVCRGKGCELGNYPHRQKKSIQKTLILRNIE